MNKYLDYRIKSTRKITLNFNNLTDRTQTHEDWEFPTQNTSKNCIGKDIQQCDTITSVKLTASVNSNIYAIEATANLTTGSLKPKFSGTKSE